MNSRLDLDELDEDEDFEELDVMFEEINEDIEGLDQELSFLFSKTFKQKEQKKISNLKKRLLNLPIALPHSRIIEFKDIELYTKKMPESAVNLSFKTDNELYSYFLSKTFVLLKEENEFYNQKMIILEDCIIFKNNNSIYVLDFQSFEHSSVHYRMMTNNYTEIHISFKCKHLENTSVEIYLPNFFTINNENIYIKYDADKICSNILNIINNNYIKFKINKQTFQKI